MVIPVVNDGATLGAQHLGPARRITTFLHRLVEFDLYGPCLARAVDGEELDRALNGAQWLHLVEDLRRDCLGRSHLQLDVYRRRGRRSKAQSSAMDDDPPPGANRDTVGSAQTGRYGPLVPDRACAYPTELLGQFGPIAERTIQGRPEPADPPARVEHPGSELKWRPVADVLIVSACQLGHPVASFVLVVAGDRSLHGSSVDPLGDTAGRQAMAG